MLSRGISSANWELDIYATKTAVLLIHLTYDFGLQVLLGLAGVILVMLSVLGSVGFFSAIGVKSTLIIMEVIPFLVLAVSLFFNFLLMPLFS